MQNLARQEELNEIDADEFAARLMLELQIAGKKRADVVRCVVAWSHDVYGSDRLSLNLSATANWQAAAKKELVSIFGIDWDSTKDFELILVSSRVVGRVQSRAKA